MIFLSRLALKRMPDSPLSVITAKLGDGLAVAVAVSQLKKERSDGHGAAEQQMQEDEEEGQ